MSAQAQVTESGAPEDTTFRSGGHRVDQSRARKFDNLEPNANRGFEDLRSTRLPRRRTGLERVARIRRAAIERGHTQGASELHRVVDL